MSKLIIECQLLGNVKGIRGNKLQFLDDSSQTLKFIEVKVNGANEADLLQFVGKNVLIKPLKVFQKDFNKYYSVDDITHIKIIDSK